ncbi:MAG: DUF4249 domain-containing protein [Salinivirgaceae bacterium]|jgi:hypothetical protein|nr:DUF4249 domain-containing protein [Salinivirgaceae bacterium]
MRKYIYILIVVFSSCIKEYNPNIAKYEDVFVVDGKLTNLPGPYVVKLSRSYKFEEKAGLPVGGAQLKIVDNTGIETELEETDKGVYVTTDNAFRGVAGKSYKLQIMLDDEIYESEMEPLIEPVPIDSVFWEFKRTDSNRNGIQLLLNTHDAQNKTRYYGWEYVDTWKYIVPIYHPDHPDRREGYASSSNYYYNIATTIHRNTDIIERHPLQVISEDVNKLYFRYSILVTQYAFTGQSYKYLKDLVSINQNQGSLFDPTPHSLTGNIKNISNKDLPVLGYFMVAGASEKRIFIDRSELPKEYWPTSGFEDCYQGNVTVKWENRNDLRQNEVVDSLMNKGFTIVTQSMEVVFGRDTVINLSLAKRRCYDSRASGTNIKPDFWTDK